MMAKPRIQILSENQKKPNPAYAANTAMMAK